MVSSLRHRLTWFGAVIVVTFSFIVFRPGCRRPPPRLQVPPPSERVTTVLNPDLSVLDSLEPTEPTPRLTLSFATQRMETRYQSLRSHILRRFEPGWNHVDLTYLDSFSIERWCSQEIELSRCSELDKSSEENHSRDWFEIALIHQQDSGDLIDGVVYHGNMTFHDGWSVRVSLSQGSPSLFSARFSRTNLQGHERSIQLGLLYEISIGDLVFQTYSPGFPTNDEQRAERLAREELSLLLSSPTSLRQTVNERLNTLLYQGNETIRGGSYENQDDLLEALHHQVDERRSIINENYESIHNHLTHLTPHF